MYDEYHCIVMNAIYLSPDDFFLGTVDDEFFERMQLLYIYGLVSLFSSPIHILDCSYCRFCATTAKYCTGTCVGHVQDLMYV